MEGEPLPLTLPLAVRCSEDESVLLELREGVRLPLVVYEGMGLPLTQPEAVGEREADSVAEGLTEVVGAAGVRGAPWGGEGVREAVSEALEQGDTLRGALGERVREGERESVAEAVGERVAEGLQVRGETVPGVEHAPRQGQGRGAARPPMGQ